MNGNLSFSKNVFGGNAQTKIAGNTVLKTNTDGGRRSLEEVRESRLEANRLITPDLDKDNQINPKPLPNDKIDNSKPIDSSKMLGAYTNNNNSATQNDLMRTRIQSLKNINRNGF